MAGLFTIAKIMRIVVIAFTSLVLLSYQNCAEAPQGAFGESIAPSTDPGFENIPDDPDLGGLDQQPVSYPGGLSPQPIANSDRLEIILSKTLNGVKATEFKLSEVIYGRITGLGSTNVFACAYRQEDGDTCSNQLPSWSSLPNEDWVYHEPTRSWRFENSFQAKGYPRGVYYITFYDTERDRQVTYGLRVVKD